MDHERLAQEQWKSARDAAATTTKVVIVLFAALIVSWMGMYGRLSSYRVAMASRKRVERQAERADKARLIARQLIGARVRSHLMSSLDGESDQVRRAEITKLAYQASADPFATLDALTKGNRGPHNDRNIQLLQAAIDSVSRSLTGQEQYAIRRFTTNRVVAEQTPFKLLGLDFSVNGFWAWLVWLLFFSGGCFYLWLARRALIRRCRRVWWLVSQSADEAPQKAPPISDALPLWIRPLPVREAWVNVLAQKPRSDAAMDPLGALCLLLLVVSFGMAATVVRMGIVSTSLLWAGGTIGAEPFIHAAVLSIVTGFLVGLALTWSSVPESGQPSKGEIGRVEVLGRRAWILSAMGALATASLYSSRINRRIRYSLLGNPRFQRPATTTLNRKRRRRYDLIRLKPGFYLDQQTRIHHVAVQGRARSLAGLVGGDLVPYGGEFGAADLHSVHSSALVPYVRAGIRRLLSGVTHKPTEDEKARVNRLPETQTRYRMAFDLTREAIVREEDRRKYTARLPNLQLYDLLGALALNSQSNELLSEANQMLSKAGLQPRDTPAVAPASPLLSRVQTSVPGNGPSRHSRHARRKQKAPWWKRRLSRLVAFQLDRVAREYRKPIEDQATANGIAWKRMFVGRFPGIIGGLGWDMHRLRPEVANYIHVARNRKIRRRQGRFHRSTMG